MRKRRGSAYITVLGTALAITVIGLSGIMASRVRLRWARNADDFANARLYAVSAIEMGLLRIQSNSDWRTFYGNGTWEADKLIGTGTYTLLGVDPADGNLADDPMHPLLLTGIGVSDDAIYKVSTTMVARVVPYDCLASAVHAAGAVTITSATIGADAPLTSNLSVTATLASVQADVEAAGTILGLTYFGSTKPLAPTRTMPGADVFDFYKANGTTISYGALPSGMIQNVLLGPTNNPYSAALNPSGIYVIDCANQPIVIKNCRIYGTLVLLNTNASSCIEGAVVWGPVVANYPSLLVSGSFKLNLSSTALNEGDLGINLNPPGAPYAGVTDVLIDDTYPSRLNGLFYVSGAVTVQQNTTLYGLLVGGGSLTLPLGTTFNVTFDSRFYDDPPPGFTDAPDMYVADGSWRRVVN